ncbi:TPA: hypothetical protein KD088_003644 [Vibrio parahaemolyticus]|nr:hypothetical protein [Vibrio parahaemolyticus]
MTTEKLELTAEELEAVEQYKAEKKEATNARRRKREKQISMRGNADDIEKLIKAKAAFNIKGLPKFFLAINETKYINSATSINFDDLSFVLSWIETNNRNEIDELNKINNLIDEILILDLKSQTYIDAVNNIDFAKTTNKRKTFHQLTTTPEVKKQIDKIKAKKRYSSYLEMFLNMLEDFKNNNGIVFNSKDEKEIIFLIESYKKAIKAYQQFNNNNRNGIVKHCVKKGNDFKSSSVHLFEKNEAKINYCDVNDVNIIKTLVNDKDILLVQILFEAFNLGNKITKEEQRAMDEEQAESMKQEALREGKSQLELLAENINNTEEINISDAGGGNEY